MTLLERIRATEAAQLAALTEQRDRLARMADRYERMWPSVGDARRRADVCWDLLINLEERIESLGGAL
jgi:hypothetical protein